MNKLRDLQKSLDNDPDFVDVKFYCDFLSPVQEFSEDELERQILILLKGTENGTDITDDIL